MTDGVVTVMTEAAEDMMDAVVYTADLLAQDTKMITDMLSVP
jgi:hypothetical protein